MLFKAHAILRWSRTASLCAFANLVPKRPKFGPIASHDVSHDKLGVKNDNSPPKIHARQEPITLCKGNLSQKKVTQDCSLKSVVLITLGFNINMSFYDE